MFNRLNNNNSNTFMYIAIAIVGLLVIFATSDPEHVPLPLLVVPFVLFGILVYQGSKLFVGRYLSRRTRAAKIVPYAMSVLVSLLLILASLHQLTWRDGILTLLFSSILLFYVWRADFLK